MAKVDIALHCSEGTGLYSSEGWAEIEIWVPSSVNPDGVHHHTKHYKLQANAAHDGYCVFLLEITRDHTGRFQDREEEVFSADTRGCQE